MKKPLFVSTMLLIACSSGPLPALVPTQMSSERLVDEAVASAAPVWIELATDPGLSGLAVAPDGALWTVAERGRAAFRVVLDGDRVASLERVPIDGIPDDTDLESVAVLADGSFVFGTESHGDGSATLLAGTRRGGDGGGGGGPIDVAPLRDVAAEAGTSLLPNQGVEGLCAAGDALVLSLETVEEHDGVRTASVMLGSPPAIHRVVLTSEQGKLSSLDCAAREGGGRIDAIAIERHFATVRLLAFEVPRGEAPTTISPTVLRDLGEIADGKNFEGVARLADGRIALVNDNQYRTLDGPSMLLLLPAATPTVAR